MSAKNISGKAVEGGGGGRRDNGGGGASNNNNNMRCSALHQLLPDLAEVIEMLDECTVEDVRKKLLETTSINRTYSELTLGLENGAQLGLFDVLKEYKVNTEYLREELKSDKYDRRTLASFINRKFKNESEVCKAGDNRGGKDLGSVRVRSRSSQSEMLRGGSSDSDSQGRSYSKRTSTRPGVNGRICFRCKRKIELKSVGKKGTDSWRRNGSCGKIRRSSAHENRRAIRPRKDSRVKRKKSADGGDQDNRGGKKSRLLVERNPMADDPPYYDIFT